MAFIKRKRKDDDNNVETRSRIDVLNDTLLELIFTRLILWRFFAASKCVSKRWNSIISNPDFTRRLPPQSFAFTLIHPDGNCVVTEHPYFQKHKFSLDFITREHKLVANTNDLIVAYHVIDPQKGEFYAANPLTKQYIVVPIPFAPPHFSYCDYIVGIAGFVDGVSAVNVSHHNNQNHGFWIVQILGGNPKSTVQIYSSETSQWKTYLFDYFDDYYHTSYRRAVTWNNKIHWMINRSKFVVIDPFNINNVGPRVLNLPTGIGNHNSVLGICQNRLRIAQFGETLSSVREHQRIQIWEIEDYDNVDDLGTNNLVKVKLVIDFELKSSLVKRIFTGIDRYDPNRYHEMVCCHPNDPQLVYFSYDDRLFYCNVVEKICKEMDYFIGFWNNAFAFVHPP